jgi:hypothetical protein
MDAQVADECGLAAAMCLATEAGLLATRKIGL